MVRMPCCSCAAPVLLGICCCELQVGCYVAASSAVLEPVDAIYTRIGEQGDTLSSWVLRCHTQHSWQNQQTSRSAPA
jgi:hypothetical protein